jgi:8-oxo-dGTP diphosphatase
VGRPCSATRSRWLIPTLTTYGTGANPTRVCDDSPVHEQLARPLALIWRAAGPSMQARVAWHLHARFGVGVTGIVRTTDGRVLLLRHRFWPDDRQWGFPGGFAKRDETFEQTVVREVREETALTVTVGRLLEFRSGDRYRAEAYYAATLADGLDGLVLDRGEILEARLFTLDALPAAMPSLHRELARRQSL